MIREEALCFVQFLHPGGEHRPDAGGVKPWNVGNHKRKFLTTHGSAVRNGRTLEAELVYWGEWEPESEVVEYFKNPAKGEPAYLWRPYFTTARTYSRLQNTDPFIFGSFFYGVCQQRRKNGPTQLRHLGRGSVILFGSSLGNDFVLDTVFVVKDWIDHARPTYSSVLKSRVPEEYFEVAIRPLYESGRRGIDACAPGTRQSWRLYVGATCEDPVEGMYSFFPCRPRSGSTPVFRRPIIGDRRIVTGSARQGFRLNKQQTIGDAVALWQAVAERVQEELWLGTYSQMPEKRGFPG